MAVNPAEKEQAMGAFDELKRVIVEIETDVIKARAGNKSASVRVRNAMQEVKALAQDVRTAILATRAE